MLEASVSKWPEENANFPHVSGLSFSVNTLGEANSRVCNVEVLNSESGKYEPLALDKTYTVASNNFILLENGDGMTMFAGAEVVSDTGILDVEVLERYVVHHLGGVIDDRYAQANGRITFTEGIQTDPPYVTDGDRTIWILVVGGVVALALITLTVSSFVLSQKAKGKK
jgi:2',3'-cyclic-nucleotide 2'-phosphodiesterase (5'-nucleotidase family)